MRTRTLLLAALAAFATASADVVTNEVGTVLMTDSENHLFPSNAAATVAQLAQTVAQAEADRAEANAIRQNQEYLDGRLDYLQQEFDKREGIVYVKGFVRMFEGAVSVSTNATAQILKFSIVSGFSAARPGYIYCKFNTWFSDDIQEPPTLKYSSSLGNEWQSVTTVYGAWEDVTQVENGEAVVYQTYAQIAELPAEYGTAFFRVFADLLGGGESIMFNVNNGISVNNIPGMTCTFGTGTNAVAIVGGVFVQNEAEVLEQEQATQE